MSQSVKIFHSNYILYRSQLPAHGPAKLETSGAPGIADAPGYADPCFCRVSVGGKGGECNKQQHGSLPPPKLSFANTSLVQRVSPRLFSNTSLQNSSLQSSSPTLLYNTLFQHFAPTLLYNTLLQHFLKGSETCLFNTSLQHASPTPLFNNSLHQRFSTTLLLSNTCLQHVSSTLLYKTFL